MPKTISQEFDEAFQKAALDYLRKTLKFDRDLAEFEAIAQTAADKRDELNRLFIEEYDARFDEARARLLDKAAQMRLDHPPPPGGGDDTAGAINREADRQVKLAHEADLKAVGDEAAQSYEDLLDRAHKRNQAHGMAREAFRQVSDRRLGGDRRTQKLSQD